MKAILAYVLLGRTSGKQEAWNELFHRQERNRFWLLFFPGLISLALIVTVLFPFRPATVLAQFLSGCFIIFLYFLRLKRPDIPARIQNQTTRAYDRLAKYNLKEKRERLTRLMETEHLYQQYDLKLNQLATLMDMSPHDLSAFINREFHVSFYDFLNQYRAREAIRLLQADPDGDILTIAYRVGFNSKSAFYRVFKAHHGINPSELRRK